MIDYKKLWIMLLERGVSKQNFRVLAELSTATMTKLNKNQYISMEVLVRICTVLECDIGDVVEIIKEQ